jgi:DNA-binding transcriptional LysR family regulator
VSVQLVPRGLRYVAEVARLGSIQAASRELRIAASAIDRQIIMLEDEFGVPLFERHPGGMRPTSVGGLVIALARRWRVDAGELFTTVRRMKGVEFGHVRLAAMDSHANGLLPGLVDHLAERYPRLALEVEIVSTDVAVELLLEDRVDVAAAFNLKPRRDLHILWTMQLPLGCVVSPSHLLAKRATVALKDIAAHPIAIQSRSLAIRRYFEDRHAWLFSERDPPVVTNSLQLVKHLAVGGGYAAITSELDTAPELLAGDLVFVPIADETARPQNICVAISARRPLSRLAKVTADALIDRMAATIEKARSLRPGNKRA